MESESLSFLSGDDDKKKSSSPFHSYSELFEKLCPTYIMYGMTYDEYWNGPNDAPLQYKKAFELKQKNENRNMWIQGMYIYTCLNDLFPLFNPMVKKGTKPKEYIDSPLPMNEKEMEEYEERKRRKQYQKMLTDTFKWKNQIAENRRKGGDNHG